MITTLAQIRAHSPCAEGWTKLLAHLGKTKAADEPLPLSVVLESNGLDDTLWCFRAVKGFDREQRLFAVWCARQVEHLMADRRSLETLAVVERYANGLASAEELDAARDAAVASFNAAWVTATSDTWPIGTAEAEAAAEEVASAWVAVEAAATWAAEAAWRVVIRVAAHATYATSARAAQTQELKRVLACTEAGIDPYPPKE